MSTDGHYTGDYRRDPNLVRTRNGEHAICHSCCYLRLNRCQLPNKTLMRKDAEKAYCDGHDYDPLKDK